MFGEGGHFRQDFVKNNPQFGVFNKNYIFYGHGGQWCFASNITNRKDVCCTNSLKDR